ncbi:hypothetical protein XELAEV_18039691mg [Xenopus laevis]|uniref:Uncharacterized protein n=1 Tax=Xenopus laevis TaxID=8355 RepID=A0A974C869_XENLA|nr:hypothetical protein XELAEV_18039691mg [Xenopus laevis]
MNSLVSYDDSDSDSERTENLKVRGKEQPVKSCTSFAVSFPSRVYEDDNFSKERASYIGNDLPSTGKYVNRAGSSNHAKKYFPDTNYASLVHSTSSSANTLRDTSSYAPKRPPSGDADSNIAIKPYIPKRQRQEQMPSNDSVGGAVTESHTHFSNSNILENVFRVSDYLKPFLLSKYTSTEIPRNLVFQMNEHTGPVNRVQWSPVQQYSHLLLSASMDTTIKVMPPAYILMSMCLFIFI